MEERSKRLLPLNLQFFAEPPEDPVDPVEPPVDPPTEPTDPPAEQTPPAVSLDDVFKSFKVEDLLARPEVSKKVQSITDSTVTKALQTAKARWQEEQLENLDEAKKLEKMTAEQRTQYQLEKDKKEFEEQRKTFEHEQLEVATGKELMKRGLDATFASYLTADTAEATNARIDEFEKTFNQAVGNALNSRMKGNPPKDTKPNSTITKESLKTMTTEEINKNWDEVQKVLAEK